VNKKLREFDRAVDGGLIDPLLWYIHFGERRPDKVTCENCIDYQMGECKGKSKPMICFSGKREPVLVVDVDEVPKV
jgi:hypothetical protein